MEYKKGAEIITDDFWYDLTDGGYIKPDALLVNQEDVDRINAAIKTLVDWKNEMERKEIIQYS